MTNCCDIYGHCAESDTCPVRTGTVLPHQAAYAARVEHHPSGRVSHSTSATQVARIKCTRPAWLPGDGVPPEAGNFAIVDLGPSDDEERPLTGKETMALAVTMLTWLLAVVGAVVLISLGTGYATERWADVLWAYVSSLP